jgi:hypothetical protein
MNNFKLLIFPLLLFGLIFADTAFAQQGQVKDIEREDLQELDGSSNVVRTMSKTVTTGSPYLSEKFLKGEAIINSMSTTQPIYLRLNIETNTVEFVRNKKVLALDSNKIEGFRIFTQEDDVLFRNGFKSDDHNIKRATFLRIINDGKTKFAAHHNASLKEDLATYGTATKKNAYVTSTKYYIIKPDGSFHKVELNQEDILDKLSDKQEQIQQLVSARNLSYEEEGDVKTIVSEYNQMMN